MSKPEVSSNPRLRGTQIPADLVRAGASGDLVVLVGSGVSKDVLPDWTGLLETLTHLAVTTLTAERAGEVAALGAAKDGKEYLLWASMLAGILGRPRLEEELVRLFGDPGLEPTPTHHALASVPGAIYLTTNYDRLLERALDDADRPYRVVLVHDRDALLTAGAGDVIKLHGDPGTPGSMVLTLDDYRSMDHGEKAWQERLKALLQGRHRILLVGYRYRDPDIRRVVQDLQAAYGEAAPRPVWLTKPDPLDEARARHEKLDLHPLLDWRDLVPWLQRLGDEIRRAQRGEVEAAVAPLLTFVKEANVEAGRALEEGRYEEYLERRRAHHAKLEAVPPSASGSEEFRKRWSESLVNLGAAELACGHRDDARLRFLEADPSALAAEGRHALAVGLLHVGEVARAREVLGDDSTGEAARVHQLIALEAGTLPGPVEGLFREWDVRLGAARWLVDRGRLAEAARTALDVLDWSPIHSMRSMDALGRAEAVTVLYNALAGSVLGRVGEPIPSGVERERAVTAIEAALARLEHAPLPTPARRLVRQVAVYYWQFTDTEEAARRAAAAFGGDGQADEGAGAGPGAIGHVVVGLGDGESWRDAVARLPPMPFSWNESVIRAELRFAAGETDEALAEALALASAHPHRAPVEDLAARLLAAQGRPAEALDHARRAFAALPGRHCRRVLAACLLGCHRASEAADLLDAIASADDDETLALRIDAAMHARPAEAPDLLRRYLDRHPEDPRSRVNLSRALLQIGRPSEAAEEAWALVEGPSGKEAGVAFLLECGRFQALSGPLDDRARSRLRHLDALLRERFPGDATAEQARLEIHRLLGFPGDLPPVDYGRLRGSALLHAVPMEEFVARWKEEAEQGRRAWDSYRRGWVSFEALCRLTGTDPAWRFAVVRRAREDEPFFLSTPTRLVGPPPLTLAGRQVVLGELEILVLLHLELGSPLLQALGPEGRLVVFRDVFDRMRDEAARLPVGAQRVALEKREALLRWLQDQPRECVVLLDEPRGARDAEIARDRGVPIVADDVTEADAPALSPLSWLGSLAERGALDTVALDRLRPSFRPAPAATTLPKEVLLPLPTLITLGAAGVLEAVARDAGVCMLVGPEAVGNLRWSIEDLRGGVDAADVAAGAFRWLAQANAEGRVVLVDRPVFPDLPEAVAEGFAETWREAISEALSWRAVLLERPERLLLTADFLVAALFSETRFFEPIRLLKWTPESFALALARVQEVRGKEIHLPDLVRALVPETGRGDTLIRLATLGFQDALRPEDLVALAERFAGLHGPHPARLLHRIEWMAGQPDHPGSLPARVRLGNLYAHAIWSAWCSGREASPRREDLTRSLLERAEALDAAPTAPLLALDQLVLFLLSQAAEAPRSSIHVGDDGSGLVSAASRAGRLWSWIARWAGPAPSRQAALERAVAEVLHVVDAAGADEAARRLPRRLIALAAQTLFLETEDDPGDAGTLLLPSGLLRPLGRGLEAVAVLSANWTDRPLSDFRLGIRDDEGVETAIDLESLLQRAAESLETNGLDAGASLDVEVPVLVPLSPGREVRLWLPLAALLLRCSPSFLSRAQGAITAAFALHDGRIPGQIARLALAPDDADARRAFAREAVTAPWRRVRRDPAIIRALGSTWTHGSFPRDVDELRVLLSEPDPLDPEAPVATQLRDRVRPGGAWEHRPDLGDLLLQVAEVPGTGILFPIRLRFLPESEDFDRHVDAALHRLDHPEDQPSGRLAGDLLFLRVAAAHRPRVQLRRGSVDLRDVVPDVLVRAVEAVTHVPRPGTLAEAEGPMLRLCARTVDRLAWPAESPDRDRLWLTWRLYSWLVAQVESLSADRRQVALESLVRVAPPAIPEERCLPDALDPGRFERDRYDHRLAAVLFAVSWMEPAVAALDGEGGAVEAGGELVGDGLAPPAAKPFAPDRLLELLSELAGREPTPSERRLRTLGDRASALGWELPAAVPDLALRALLGLDLRAFRRLDPKARRRWLDAIAAPGREREGVPFSLGRLVAVAAGECAPDLGPDERSLLRERVRALPTEGDPLGPRLLASAGLLAVGDEAAGDDLRAWVLAHPDHPLGPEAASRYLEAAARSDPDRMDRDGPAFVEAAIAAGVDPSVFVLAPARALFSAPPQGVERARALLLRLAEGGPGSEDERVRRTLRLLGMSR